ncbi:hypothetical protein BJ878DRAFT_498698 [Calycina marina]|uniref:Uncharacterized protein n=1 Tax=Calycina marina TaxID=1763456 RepID=A0A9P7Z658_9HELO|nr:hypothetical protein BJ878DRAFT_498698 [Calycina marina]
MSPNDEDVPMDDLSPERFPKSSTTEARPAPPPLDHFNREGYTTISRGHPLALRQARGRPPFAGNTSARRERRRSSLNSAEATRDTAASMAMSNHEEGEILEQSVGPIRQFHAPPTPSGSLASKPLGINLSRLLDPDLFTKFGLNRLANASQPDPPIRNDENTAPSVPSRTLNPQRQRLRDNSQKEDDDMRDATDSDEPEAAAPEPGMARRGGISIDKNTPDGRKFATEIDKVLNKHGKREHDDMDNEAITFGNPSNSTLQQRRKRRNTK